MLRLFDTWKSRLPRCALAVKCVLLD